MNDVLLHPVTRRAIEAYLDRPHHALLLLGGEGVGKLHIARHASANILDVAIMKLATTATFHHIQTPKDKSSISIEMVRELHALTKLKQGGASKRIILIQDAHTMSTEAQNAILKLLEEPPADTYFIVTATSADAMLPTIRSRSQLIAVYPSDNQSLQDYFVRAGHDAEAVSAVSMLGGGLPGLTAALLNDESHPLKSALGNARDILKASQFERLAMVDSLSKQKDMAVHILNILQHMSRTALVRSASAGGASADSSMKQWHKIQTAAYDARRAYDSNAQSKLVLTNFMLSL